MKIEKQYLQKIIKEEIEHVLNEEDLDEGWKELAKSIKHGFQKGKEAGSEAEKAARERYSGDPESMEDVGTTGLKAKLKAGIGAGLKAAKEKYGQEMSDKAAYEKDIEDATKSTERPGESPVMKTSDSLPIVKSDNTSSFIEFSYLVDVL